MKWAGRVNYTVEMEDRWKKHRILHMNILRTCFPLLHIDMPRSPGWKWKMIVTVWTQDIAESALCIGEQQPTTEDENDSVKIEEFGDGYCDKNENLIENSLITGSTHTPSTYSLQTTTCVL